MRSKKGIELSMNTIIIALLALIVLVILILIVTGQVGKTRLKLNETSATYVDKCEAPGTGRVCRTIKKCQDMGAINYGLMDCGRQGVDMTCCSE